MIRIGPKPGIYFVAAQNDMSHFTPGHYDYSRYHYVPDDLYTKLLAFSDPSVYKPTEFEKDEMVGKTAEEIKQTSFGNRMKQTIDMNPSKSLLWQYDGFGENLVDRFRHIVCLGERSFRVWSAYEAYVLLPITRLRCGIMNRLRRSKMEKEQAEWDEKLKKFYEKAAQPRSVITP